ncbi:copper-binding protein [Bradyrhizobium septentrionale]|uniref:Copper-binding protein n=2 Tax=Bradyrhizobium septentrionale TaxID=1404411 RepID=A0ABZ2NZ65_9BRAD|nr:copper-binding protein [Bradyrhizobium septentrionale]UGY19468.1 copper-binding protein [Bradyrhizobium septentrionale]UGY28237.1 copper-binding protein [Bradyrhizobium septentrionale]
MTKSTLALCVVILWPAMALAAPTEVSENQQAVVALAEAAAIHPPSTQTLRGVVDSIDERNDTIRIRLSPDRTEPFKVQDGLLFNAVRFGDPVAFSVQDISGFRTIVGLSKE